MLPGRTTRLVAALLLALLVAPLGLLTVAAGPASAHATLVGTDPADGQVLPAAPDAVTFTFDEAVLVPPHGFRVFDAQGDPVRSQSRAREATVVTDLPDDLGPGTYVVVWRAVSDDGHPIVGSMTFAVGAPSPHVAVPKAVQADADAVRRVLGVVQALDYVALLVAAGLVLFLTVTLRGVDTDSGTDLRRRPRAVLWWASGTAVLAAVVLVPLSGAYELGLGLHQLGEAEAVDMEVVAYPLLVLLCQLGGLAVALADLTSPRLAVPAAAVAAASPVLVGHSRATDPVWLVAGSDVLHLAAGAAWLGGLVGLVLVLPALARRPRDGAVVLSRFSGVAAGLLGVLAVTGTVTGWRILRGWGPLVHTSFGQLLLVKVGIAAVVGLVAAYNHWWLVPAAEGRVAALPADRASARVRVAVRVEAALLVVLLGVTGFLVESSPRESPSTPGSVPTAGRAR